LDRAQSAVTCHTNDVIQDVTEKYWLSTNGVIHCKSYNLQAGAKRPQSGAKRPAGETPWWQNV